MANYSDFWVDDSTRRQLQSGEIDVTRLAAIKRSISDFVKILTGKMIPVKFYDEDGPCFTDGHSIVISSDITEETFDQTVGTTLHEASHIVLSDFHIFRNIEHHVPDEMKEKAEKKFGESEWLANAVKNLLNYVEDRRIDNWVFTTSPGYKGYYHAMYDAYWHSDEISEKLASPMFREENMQSYMFRIINLTNDNTDLEALDGLRNIHDLIGLSSIDRLDSTREALDVTLDIMDILLEQVEDIEFDENGDVRYVPGEGGEGDDEADPVDWDELSDLEKDMLKDAIQDQMDFLDGEIDKEPLDPDKAAELEAIEEAGVSRTPVGEGTGNVHKVDCIVVDKIHMGLVQNNNFAILSPRENRTSIDAVQEGIRLGRMLGRKLKVRSEKRNTSYTRKRSGKLDSRLLSELSYNSRIFHTVHTEEYNEAFIHISVDASGSMSGDKWFQAMSTTVAIAKACSMIDNIVVQISFRSTAGSRMYDGKPLVVMAYDSRENPFVHIKNYFPFISSGGTTPEGLTFEAISDRLVMANQNMDAYFLNFSDGRPNFNGGQNSSSFSYRGDIATSHTRKEVNNIRKRGIKILSYYIDGSPSPQSDPSFVRMYGKDAKFISVSNLHQISSTMNKKFLEK